MADAPKNRPNRIAASLLATALVLLLGALGAAVVMAAMGGDPLSIPAIFGCALAMIVLVTWVTRATPSTRSSVYNWVRGRHMRPAHMDYVPSVREGSRRKHFGTNTPPSVDDVRELKEGGNTWVPSKARSRKKSRRGK